MPRMKPLFALLPVLILAACASTSTVPVEETEFDPNLAINLQAMERTDSGLYIQDIVPGEGTQVRSGHRVQIYYVGWLSSGAAIDVTAPPEDPVEFRVGEGRLIRGLEQGVQGMRPGGQRRIVIPPALGYGSRQPAPVPPNSVLVFLVELVEVL
jgi:FKBP-type peptidyl-prolyl cis-trans isomerase FkpA